MLLQQSTVGRAAKTPLSNMECHCPVALTVPSSTFLRLHGKRTYISTSSRTPRGAVETAEQARRLALDLRFIRSR